MSWLITAILLIVAYLLGSLATGYWLGKAIQGIDIREVGSGSTGATNVLRVLGKKVGALVLIIDAAKGALAVNLLGLLPNNVAQEIPLEWHPWLIVAMGLAAILGHSKSIFINFTGGKSVATSLGIFLSITPWVGLSALVSFSIVLAIFRIVSLGSIIGALTLMIAMVLSPEPLPYSILALITGLYVILRHQGNIQRLVAGTEPKIGQKLETI